jgi:ELWxxDGT repeat protein
MRTWSALALLGLLFTLPAFGLEPYLVKDINPVPAVTGSSPSNFVSLGGVAVFTAFKGETGLTLWRSDGTPAGTWRLAEICPLGGACGNARVLATVGGRAFLNLGPDLWITDGTDAGTLRLTDSLIAVGPAAVWVPEQRVLFFFASDKPHGTELWRSDGTPAGTRLVADLVPGPQSPLIGALMAFGGRAWFSTWIKPRGGAIWRSDGTQRGTVVFKQSSVPGIPSIAGVVGKRLLFSGQFGKQGGLWSTDGTERGTSLILRVRGRGYDMVVQNGRLFFVADTPGHGQELWVSDGTVRGTRVVSDIPGKESFFADSGAHSLYLPRTSIPGRFLFQAWDPARGVELWVSDGTPAGTRLVRDVCPGPCQGTNRVLATNQGLFYFAGTDGTHGVELWVSDGTAAGTRMVRDLCPGSCGSDPFFPSRFAGRLLFSARDGVSGRELWSTDGTAAGTVRITDFAEDDPVYYQQGTAVTTGGGRFLFAADEGGIGLELWSTDGTAEGGQELIADINEDDFGGSLVSGMRALGDDAFFFADDGLHGFELWTSDGTDAGTRLVADLEPGPEPILPPTVLASAVAGGKLFLLLFGYDEGYSLWRTDGTADGTLRLRGAGSSPVLWGGTELRAVGGTVFFTLVDGDLGTQLWATDGTQAGTRQVVDSGPGKALFSPFGLAELGGSLYFFATAMDGSFGLWRSDGTAATPLNTVPVKSFGAPYGAFPLPTLHAGRLWFFGAAPSGYELWTSDGTEAGTRIVPLSGLPRAGFMASIGGKLMISGYRDGGGLELWATDGTQEGTRKVGPAVYNNLPGIPWTVFQGRLFYVVDERFDGHPKLWTSDGTEAGTGPLLDRDGKTIPAPLGFAALGDRLIFTTAMPPAVWQSDGTAAGTFPMAPMRPIGSNSGAVARAGDRVFFGAWDPAMGQELWAVEP